MYYFFLLSKKCFSWFGILSLAVQRKQSSTLWWLRVSFQFFSHSARLIWRFVCSKQTSRLFIVTQCSFHLLDTSNASWTCDSSNTCCSLYPAYLSKCTFKNSNTHTVTSVLSSHHLSSFGLHFPWPFVQWTMDKNTSASAQCLVMGEPVRCRPTQTRTGQAHSQTDKLYPGKKMVWTPSFSRWDWSRRCLLSDHWLITTDNSQLFSTWSPETCRNLWLAHRLVQVWATAPSSVGSRSFVIPSVHHWNFSTNTKFGRRKLSAIRWVLFSS